MPKPAPQVAMTVAATFLAALAIVGAPLHAQGAPAAAPSPRSITVYEADNASAERQRTFRELQGLVRRLNAEHLDPDEKRKVVEQLANLMLKLSEGQQAPQLRALEFQRAPLVRGQPVTAEHARTLEQSRRLIVAEGVPLHWAPQGWVGLNVTGPHHVRLENGEQFVRFLAYPQVVSVDPSSPADRAGIRRGDTLVAYNGTDVRQEIAMGRLLVPSSRISVQVRRDGRTRNVPVLVATAPRNVVDRRFDLKFPEAGSAEVVMLEPSRAPGAAARAPARLEVVQAPTVRTGTVVTSMAPTVVRGVPYTPRFPSNALLGARMETVSKDLHEATGLPRGMLVLEVAQDSPAHAAGLREGDVIIAAGGRDAHSLPALRALLQRADASEVQLTLQRKKARRNVTLRW